MPRLRLCGSRKAKSLRQRNFRSFVPGTYLLQPLFGDSATGLDREATAAGFASPEGS